MKRIYALWMMAMIAMTSFAQTSEDIVISPTSGDITAALNNALSGKTARSITINLAAGATYTLSNPISPSGSLVINGAKGAVIDATDLKSAPSTGGKSDEEEEGKATNASFILMSSTPSVSQTNGYYRVDQITIKDVTIKGLKNALFFDHEVKYCVLNFTLDNVLLQAEASGKQDGLIAFKKGGYKDFTIKNSTVYGNNSKYAKRFIVSRADLHAFGFDTTKELHNITYLNNTFVNVLPTSSDEAWADDAFVGADYVNYNIQNNIWYGCGLNIAIGLVGKDVSPNAKKLFAKNSYYNPDEASDVVKDQAVLETAADNSNDMLTTDPTFADISKADFHVSPGSLQARYQTGDPRWLVPYNAAQALPADIVLNLPKADNITDRLNAAFKNVDKVGDITIILAMNAKYVLTQTIKSSGSVTIVGNGATVNCTKINGPMIILEGTQALANNINADGTVGDKNPSYKHVETVNISGIKTTLKKVSTILKETQKTLVDNVLIDDCVFEVEGTNNLFDFAGYPAILEISNSTIWSETGHTGYLLRTGGRVRDLDKSQNNLTQAITIDYCTLYQISRGKGFNSLAGKASRTLNLTLTNSIIYNCTANGQEINGWMGGGEADGPTMTYDKNTYWNNGAVQAGWIDENDALDGRDLTRTAFKADPGFYDVEGGDFAIANMSPQAQVPEGQPQYGDPRWSTWAAGESYISTSFNLHCGIVLPDKTYANEGTLINVTVTAHEYHDIDAITVTDELGNNVPISISQPAFARASSEMIDTEESVTISFIMPATDVTVVATFIEEETVGIKDMTASASSQDGKWYTLGGTLVEKPTKGVYIHNNKKVVVR